MQIDRVSHSYKKETTTSINISTKLVMLVMDSYRPVAVLLLVNIRHCHPVSLPYPVLPLVGGQGGL